VVDLAGRHQNVRPWLEVGRRLDDFVQVDIGGKRQWCLAIDN
jgi:hypothetical protein